MAFSACARALFSCALALSHARPVDERVDHEKRLAFFNIGAFGEEHLFEVALDAGADFDELLGADAAHVIAVNIDVFRLNGFDGHDRKRDRCRPRPEQDDEQHRHDHKAGNDSDPLASAQSYPDMGDTGGRFFHTVQVQLLQIRFQFVKFHKALISLGAAKRGSNLAPELQAAL